MVLRKTKPSLCHFFGGRNRPDLEENRLAEGLSRRGSGSVAMNGMTVKPGSAGMVELSSLLQTQASKLRSHVRREKEYF